MNRPYTRFAVFVGYGAALGIACAVLSQWVLAWVLPPVGLLAVAAWSSRQSGTASLAAAWLLGWIFDAMSAAPPGTHAFVLVCAWIATRFASHQVQLRSAGAFSLYATGLALASAALTALLFGRPGFAGSTVVPVVVQALLCGVFAAPARYALWKLLERIEGADALRGGVLDPGAALP